MEPVTFAGDLRTTPMLTFLLTWLALAVVLALITGATIAAGGREPEDDRWPRRPPH